MIFLIEYNRPKGTMVSFREFGESERAEAQRARLELELKLSRDGVDNEVVLLEAKSEQVLRKTHRRYFETLAEIGKPVPEN